MTSLLRNSRLYRAVGLVGLLIHLFYARDLYRLGDRLLAWLLFAIFLHELYLFFNGDGVIPLLPLVTGEFYLLYGAAQLTQDRLLLMSGVYVPLQQSITTAMVLVVAADVSLIAGFRLASRHLRRSRWHIGRIYPDVAKAGRVSILIFAVLSTAEAFIANLRPELIQAEFRNIALSTFNPYLGLTLLLFVAYRDRAALAVYRPLAYGMTALLSLIGLFSGMLEPAIVPVCILMAASWIWGRKVRWRLGTVILIGFVFLNPVKYEFRASVVTANEISTWHSAVERLLLWRDAAEETWGNAFQREENVETVASRASSLIAFAQVVEWVPVNVPYNLGSGFGSTLLYFIPRILWPAKPEISDLVNNRYAVEFGLTTIATLRTATIGLVEPMDGYWDFGIAGAILYPLLLGLLLGFTFGNVKHDAPVGVVLGIVFCAFFFQILSGLQMILASLFGLGVGSWVACAGISLLSRSFGMQVRDLTPLPVE